MGLKDRLQGAYNALFSKSFSGNEQIQGALSEQFDIEKSQASQDMKSLVEDPMGIVNAMGYKDRPYSLSYDVLRRMSTKDAVISSIINTRVGQVSSFTSPARFSRSGIGYEIRLRDPDKTPTKQDTDIITSIEKFLENTGFDNNNERDSFDTFIRKITRDRLTYDQVNFEVVPDRKGRPAEFYAVDASTIRIATEELKNDNTDYAGGKVKKGEEIKYCQVINGVVTALFTKDEMAFETANPRTDIYVAGYGFSELEMLIHQVTSHLWAEEYNSRFFSQGGTTKGVLNLKSNAQAPISPHQLDSFKRQWISQVSGMTGAWKTPVVSVDGLEYINVSQSNREMEFEKWMNYLINVACAVYQIDPAEINFPNRGGATGGGGGLGDGGIEDRLKHSKDKGLRPLLRFIESTVNKHIVSKFGEEYVFSFAGLDSKSEAEIVDLNQKRVKVYKTVNEIRKEEGLEPIEGGDIILDPTYIQYLMNLQAQQQGGAEDPGLAGEEGAEEQAEEGSVGEQEEDGDSDDSIYDDEDWAFGGSNKEDKEVEKSISSTPSRKEKYLVIEIE